jgi:predicted nucleic acid-binding protein
LILYLDTSALVKRYFEEPYSSEVAEQWQEADEIATSSVAYAEALASFHRKSREADLDAGILDAISDNLRSDWQTLIRIQVYLITGYRQKSGSRPYFLLDIPEKFE